MRHFKILCLLSVLCFLCLPAFAQDDPNFETGLKPFGSYHGGNIDTINLMNGNMTLDIPLISYPQRGGKLKLEFALHYTNLGTFEDQAGDSITGFYNVSGPFTHGFSIVQVGAPNGAPIPEDCPNCINTAVPYQGFVTLSDGSIHQMQPSATNVWKSIDGSGYQVSFINGGTTVKPQSTLPNTGEVITDPSGTRYQAGPMPFPGYTQLSIPGLQFPFPAPSSVEDTNGNLISYSNSSYLDTLGRTIPAPPVPPIASSYSSTTTNCTGTLETTWEYNTPPTSTLCVTFLNATQDFSGCSGPLPTYLATLWSLPGPNGGTYAIKFCYALLTETIPYLVGCSQVLGPTTCPPQTYQANELQSVVLPNGTTWTFAYTTDGNADLAQVTFPTGGTLSYTWTTAPPF